MEHRTFSRRAPTPRGEEQRPCSAQRPVTSSHRGSGVLEAGAKVPDVGASDQDGNNVRLRDFAGRKLVVYFYPKADTPGCTAESQTFRDLKGDLTAAGAAIVGVSRDTVAAQKKFAEKYGLNF